MTCTFITGSDEKFAEARRIIPSLQKLKVDLPEIQSLSAKEVLEAKLRQALSLGHDNVLVEDTGLYFGGLRGALPGPLIKWFVKPLGNDGLWDLARRLDTQVAYAQTTIGFAGNDSSEAVYFEGIVHGDIVAPKGVGYGWDAIFRPQGYEATLAELGAEVKSKISHRALAFGKLAGHLKSIGLF